MDFYQRGKIEVTLNGKTVGFVDAVGILRHNGTTVNLSIEGVTVDGESAGANPIIRENYDSFFKKLNKAFSKE
jgi:hypothetical protein